VTSKRKFIEINGTSPRARALLASRTPDLVGCKDQVTTIFRRLRMAIIGTGSVGLAMCSHASRMHPESMYLVDPGRFKDASLLTHPVSADVVGQAKASTAARLAKDVSPDTRVFYFPGPVQTLPAITFDGLDCVLLATDNFAAEIEVGQRCLHHEIPLFQASVHGPTLVAQVRFFANTKAQGPCPRCCYNAAELAQASSHTVHSCEGFYGDDADAKVVGQKTESFSFLCALAADLCVTQVVRYVARLGQPLHDCVLQYCGYTHETTVTPLDRRQDCPCDHQVWEADTAPRPLADCTLHELIRQAGLSNGELRTAACSIDDLQFVESGSCPGCDHRQPIGRFISSLRSVAACTNCGRQIDADLFYAHRPAPISLLADLLDRPLRSLIATEPDSVLISGRRSLLLKNPADGDNS